MFRHSSQPGGATLQVRGHGRKDIVLSSENCVSDWPKLNDLQTGPPVWVSLWRNVPSYRESLDPGHYRECQSSHVGERIPWMRGSLEAHCFACSILVSDKVTTGVKCLWLGSWHSTDRRKRVNILLAFVGVTHLVGCWTCPEYWHRERRGNPEYVDVAGGEEAGMIGVTSGSSGESSGADHAGW